MAMLGRRRIRDGGFTATETHQSEDLLGAYSRKSGLL